MKQRYRTANQIWVREHNLSILLRYLWGARGPIARSELTKTSGLNKSTVGNLLFQLREWNFIVERGTSEPSVGRPGEVFDINENTGQIIGVEIGISEISVILTDFKANPLWRETCKLSVKTPDLIFNQAEELITKAIQKSHSNFSRLLGIGIGISALVGKDLETLLFPPDLKTINKNLSKLWQEKFDLPVLVANDANAATIGEQLLGDNVLPDENFIYIASGEGLGGGVVINGKLYGGNDGFAGEFGHITINPDGEKCQCGNKGCWENYVSPQAILSKWILHPESNLDARTMLQKNSEEIMTMFSKAIAEDDPAALEVLKDIAQYFGIGISNLANIFNPKSIILGGQITICGEKLLPIIRKDVEKRLMPVIKENLEILYATYGQDSVLIGTTALIINAILNNPSEWCPSEEKEIIYSVF